MIAICALLPLAATSPAAADTTVHADLVEQNKSGVHGSVTLTATDKGALRVKIRANGLIPGPHAQHIHGAVGAGHFSCASMQADADGDGWISTEEASGEYGNVFLALTTRGPSDAESGLAIERMPVADARGRLRYKRTLPADQVPPRLLRELANLHVVLHGIDANGNEKYDLEALGESTFAAGLGLEDVPEETTNPAACGVVTGAGLDRPPRGGVETGGEESQGAPWSRGAVAALTVGGVLLLAAGILLGVRPRRHADPDTAQPW